MVSWRTHFLRGGGSMDLPRTDIWAENWAMGKVHLGFISWYPYKLNAFKITKRRKRGSSVVDDEAVTLTRSGSQNILPPTKKITRNVFCGSKKYSPFTSLHILVLSSSMPGFLLSDQILYNAHSLYRPKGSCDHAGYETVA